MQIDLAPIQAVAQRVEVIGRAVLVQADCRDVLPVLPKVDACVTDPPYGLGDKLSTGASGGWSKLHVKGGHDWDQAIPENIPAVVAAGTDAIIWGGITLPFLRAGGGCFGIKLFGNGRRAMLKWRGQPLTNQCAPSTMHLANWPTKAKNTRRKSPFR